LESGILTAVNTVSGEKRARENGVDEAIRTQRASLILGAPRLAEPFWYQQAHSGRWTDAKENATKDAATLKAERRERTKAARASARRATMTTARERALALLAA
jgi:hypothetical protein